MKQLEEQKNEATKAFQKYHQPKAELSLRPFEPPSLENEYEMNVNKLKVKKASKPRKLNALQHSNPLTSPFNSFKGPIDLNNMDKGKLREHLKSNMAPMTEEFHETILKNSVSKAKLKPLAGGSSVPHLPHRKKDGHK